MTLYIPFTLVKGLPVSMTSQACVMPSFLVNGKLLNETDKNLFIEIRSIRFGNACPQTYCAERTNPIIGQKA